MQILKGFSHKEFFSCSETEICTLVVLTYKLSTVSPVTVLKGFAEGVCSYINHSLTYRTFHS